MRASVGRLLQYKPTTQFYHSLNDLSLSKEHFVIPIISQASTNDVEHCNQRYCNMYAVTNVDSLIASNNLACQNLRCSFGEILDVLENHLRFFSSAGGVEIGQIVPF